MQKAFHCSFCSSLRTKKLWKVARNEEYTSKALDPVKLQTFSWQENELGGVESECIHKHVGPLLSEYLLLMTRRSLDDSDRTNPSRDMRWFIQIFCKKWSFSVSYRAFCYGAIRSKCNGLSRKASFNFVQVGFFTVTEKHTMTINS